MTTYSSKMNSLVVVCLALVLVEIAVAVPAGKDQKYTTKYDNLNIEEILQNDRLFNNYYKCLMDKGPCTPDGQELKGSVRDALQTKCSKCSERQKKGAEIVFKFLINKKPKQFEALEKKYDPQGKYRSQYREEAAKYGVKV